MFADAFFPFSLLQNSCLTSAAAAAAAGRHHPFLSLFPSFQSLACQPARISQKKKKKKRVVKTGLTCCAQRESSEFETFSEKCLVPRIETMKMLSAKFCV
jgi:hypothetical protein